MQILPQYMFAVASWLLTAQLIWSVWKAIAEGMTHLKNYMKFHAVAVLILRVIIASNVLYIPVML